MLWFTVRGLGNRPQIQWLYTAHYTLLVLFLFGWLVGRARRAGGRSVSSDGRAGTVGQSVGRAHGRYIHTYTYIVYIHIINKYIYIYIAVDIGCTPRFTFYAWYYIIIKLFVVQVVCVVQDKRHTQSPRAHTHNKWKGRHNTIIVWWFQQGYEIYIYRYIYINIMHIWYIRWY